jgi:hypothetical protein
MRTFQQQLNPIELEQLPLQIRRSMSSELACFWQSFLGFWHSPPREPRVWRRSDRFGKVYWQVYDPLHDCTIRFDDEQNMLMWLDDQHYRRSRPNPWDLDWNSIR